MRITQENAWLERDGEGPAVVVPKFMADTIEEFIRLARTSPHVNQQSGVSVRGSIASMETLVSNAERRGILLGEKCVVPRISDLANVNASCRGKIELMLAEDEQAEDKLIAALLGEAVKNVAAHYLELDTLEPIIQQFQAGKVNVEIGDDLRADQIVKSAGAIRDLLKTAKKLCTDAGLSADDPAAQASAAEFILEALYVNDRLSKYIYRGSTFYKR